MCSASLIKPMRTAKNKMTIIAVIWDLGGVLVRTEDLTPRDDLAKRLGLSRNELNVLVFGTPEDSRAQLGEISHDEHWENIRQRLSLSADEIPTMQREFFAGDQLDTDLIGYIRTLKLNYRSALLSNALSNMRIAINEDWHIADAFHLMVISAEVGLMKPDPAVYQLTLQRLGVKPSQAVFIDDFSENVAAAGQVGMHTILFQNTDQIRSDLQSLLADDSQDIS